MAQAARLSLRLQKELKLLLSDPPPGASFPFLSSASDLSSLTTIDAHIEGPEGTVYAKGVFHLVIQIPERYPFQPPIVTFATPIYHPNIDNGGRICLDILNLPPKGAWQPSLNVSTVITSIGLLLSEPNPDDGLMCEASREYKYNRQVFNQKARLMTERYAKIGVSGQTSSTKYSETNLTLTAMEVKGLQEESNCSVGEFSSRDKRPLGDGQKLSTDFSSTSHKMDNDEVVNNLFDSHLLSDIKNHTDGVRRELKGTHNDYQVRSEKSSGTRKKLSLGSTIQMHKKDDHATNVEEPKLSWSFHNGVSVSSLRPLISQDQDADGAQGKHRSHDCESKYNSSKLNYSELSGISHEVSSVSPNASQQKNVVNGKPLLDTKVLPSFVCSISTVVQPSLFHSIDNPDEMHRMENGSSCSAYKKICLSSRKLSLKSRPSSKSQEDADKENVITPAKLPSSTYFKATNKPDIGRKPGLLVQSQESNDDGGELYLDALKQQDHNKYQNDEVGWEKEAAAAESVVVLDSEDSDEEKGDTSSRRSKLSLRRKCMAKRKTKA